jgi:hypothetical protein
MAQFAFLAGQPGVFHDLLFTLGQLQALHVDGHGDGGQRHQQGHRRQQQNFQAQLHRGFVSARAGLLRCIISRIPEETGAGIYRGFYGFRKFMLRRIA